MGPVQVLVVGFDHPTYSGDVLTELSRLREAGIVRLIDLLLVSRGVDGSLDVLDTPPGLPPDTGRVAAAVLGQPEDESADAHESVADDEPTWSLAEAVPMGTTAAVALLEHTWAVPLTAAIQRSGGTPLDETWLAGEDVELLETLLADVRKDS